MDTIAVGKARTAPSHHRRSSSKHFRRTKLLAAFAMAALVGMGSYAATYRALDLISAPPPAPGSVVSVTPVNPDTASVPSTPTASSPRPLP